MRSSLRLNHRPALRSAMALGLCAALTAPLLGGCFFGAAAAITAGSMAAVDRRTVGIQVEDRSIQLKADSAISQRFGENVHVNATVYNRQVLLTGEAPDEATRSAVEAAVANVQNIRLLVNDIQIGPKSTFSSRSNDAVLTTKVKASLFDAQDLFANAFKITTEAGAVYIMGLVTEREANRAAQIASGVSGVNRVVKVVDTITEQDLTRLTATPNNGSNQAPINSRP
ncbi:MAG: BON domain-containing protein [Limnobacter sp.]|uniref:BON domain-containing protein n=1 Tax=Limnobacter sp. TaxID=2003368 RepID=UPI00391DF426